MDNPNTQGPKSKNPKPMKEIILLTRKIISKIFFNQKIINQSLANENTYLKLVETATFTRQRFETPQKAQPNLQTPWVNIILHQYLMGYQVI